MPCTKCGADFNLIRNWKHLCSECGKNYCYNCIRKPNGIFYCDICLILIRRPPDRSKLMELKSKDLQNYLAKNCISTHGLVEKAEVVDLFFSNHIPVGRRKPQNRFTNMFSSVPNVAVDSPINNIRSYVGNVINPQRSSTPQHRPCPNRVPTNSSPIHHTTIPPYSSRSNPPSTASSPMHQETTAGGTERASSPSAPPTTSAPPVPPSPILQPRSLPKISDYTSLDEINDLSVKQLKELLQLNRIDYKGCVEKEELLNKVTCLWIDFNNQKDSDELETEELCKICMDGAVNCVLLECGHVCTCVDCGKKLAECPICRQYIVRVVRMFKA